MIGYNPSHLNKNETLLEAFHRVEAYLIEHPLYQLYQTTDNYVVDKFDYSLGNIVLPDYGEVSAGDVVLFNNVYYAVVLSVDKVKQTFNIDEGIDFRGPQGPKGDKGDRGIGGAGSNPNLLINPNFAINQRGQASYTGSTTPVYCVDRWHLNGDSTFETVSKKVSLLKQYSLFWQDIENYNDLKGKTVTFSISVSNVSGNALYMKVYGGQDIHITTDGIYTVTTTLSTSITKFGCGLSRSTNETGEASCVVNWAKLEIGSVATEFSPPSIAEELPKCQRYFLIRRGYSRALSPYALYQAYISFGTRMRVIPTSKVYAVNSSGSRVGAEKTIFNLTTSEIVDIARNPQYLSAYGCAINSSGALVQNNEYMFDIECDAEI